MKPAFDVIVCGSLHLDIVVHGPRLPRLDETVTGTHWKKLCGGKGGNQAVMSAKAGARTAMIGRVGNDDFGQTLSANLKLNDVDIQCITTDKVHATGISVAIIESAGDYGAVIVSGSNLTLRPEMAASAWSALGGAMALILQNEIPEAVNIAIALVAKAAGARVVLNAAPARPMSDKLLQLVDVLVVNRVEAEMISGLKVENEPTAMVAMPLLSKKANDVIITLGGEGLVFKPRGAAARFLPAEMVQVKSTHGAGDCFIGVLVCALAKGTDLSGACALANQAAAKFVAGNTLD